MIHVVVPSKGFLTVELPLFQRRNWALARSVYEYLSVQNGLPSLTEAAMRRAILAQPPGRLERFEVQGKTLILDGAHSPQKIAALRATLQASGIDSVAVLASLVAAPEPKLDAVLAELRPLAAHLIVPAFTVIQDLAKRSPPAADMAARAKRSGFTSVEILENLCDALSSLLRRPEPVLLVTGSLYLVSKIRKLVVEERRR